MFNFDQNNVYSTNMDEMNYRIKTSLIFLFYFFNIYSGYISGLYTPLLFYVENGVIQKQEEEEIPT